MIGKFLSKAIRVATLPLDAASAGFDIVTGGDGSKRSRTGDNNPSPLALAEEIRDAVAKAAEEIDR